MHFLQSFNRVPVFEFLNHIQGILWHGSRGELTIILTLEVDFVIQKLDAR